MNPDAGFDRLMERFDALERKIDSGERHLTALILGTWATTILTILFHR